MVDITELTEYQNDTAKEQNVLDVLKQGVNALGLEMKKEENNPGYIIKEPGFFKGTLVQVDWIGRYGLSSCVIKDHPLHIEVKRGNSQLFQSLKQIAERIEERYGKNIVKFTQPIW